VYKCMSQCAEGAVATCAAVAAADFTTQTTGYQEIVTETLEKGTKTSGDVSMWSSMAGVTTVKDPTGLSVKSNAVMRAFLAARQELEFGVSADELSAQGFAVFDCIGLSGQNIGDELLPEGMSALMLGIASGEASLNLGSPRLESSLNSSPIPLDIKYNHSVSKVAYAYETKLHTITAIAGGVSTTFEADYVVCTLPHGVLSSGAVAFEPGLSADFTTAIDSMGSGNLVRVSLLFESVWWSSSNNFFMLSQPEFDKTTRGFFTYFLNGKQLMDGRPVLLTFATGEAAARADGMNDAETWIAIRANLVQMFGTAVPASCKMLKTSWASDPFAKGTHSYPKVGASNTRAWKALQLMQTRNLFFAGEHTSEKYYGTLHGAVFEGQRAARALMDEARV